MKTEWKCVRCKQEFYTVAEAYEHFEKSACNDKVPISTVIVPVRRIQ